VIAPVMPFLADELWRNLVADACENAPDSVHLAGWPELPEPDGALLAEIDEVRAIVELGRKARAEAGLPLRQPLRRATVYGASSAVSHADLIRDELRVKEVEFTAEVPERVSYKPNLRLLGPRLGKELPRVRAALEAGEVEQLPDGQLRAGGIELGPKDILIEPRNLPGAAHSPLYTVELDTTLDPELERERRVLDLIHTLNGLRKERGLELTDRIAVTVPASEADLLAEHADWIKQETLAVRIRADGGSLEIERVER
jgi:isoleucyl-tRNA synthetase